MIYKYITKPEQICLLGNLVGLDIETDGLNPRTNNILLIQLSDVENTYIFDARVLPKEYFVSLFEENKEKTFIAHNAKFDIGMLYCSYGYSLEKIFDTMLAESVLYAGKGKLMKSLKDILGERFNIELDKSLQTSFLTPTRSFSQEQLEYAAQDSQYLIDIYNAQMKEITEGGFSTIMQLENNLVPVVMRMEVTGLTLSPERLFPVIEREANKANMYEQELFDIAGKEFNPRSPQQVKVIFHELAKKTGKKFLMIESTGEPVIKHLNHPFPKTLLKYRGSAKLVSTYGVKLIERIEDDGKIHGEFNQIGAVTGRFSSSKPNLQNIPAGKEFRTPYIASEGYDFCTADYSQIELRLAGVVSGEEKILSEYRKPDADLHRLSAANVFQVARDEVTPEQRKHGKTANFECLYGSSAWSLAEKQNISIDMAERIVNGFWNGYPTLRDYKNKIGRETVVNEFVRTPLGRIRYFQRPGATDPVYKYKISAIKREGWNMRVQGYAADIMKYSMILVDKALGDNGRLVLTVHDEVGVELKKEHSKELMQLVLDTMEKAGTILVKGIIPMKAEGVLMDSWTK